MRNAIVLVLAAFALVSCQAFQDVNAIADAVVKGLEPALKQIEGLTPEQNTAILQAIKDSIVGNLTLPEGGFDWETPAWAVGSAVAAYFGINIRRDHFRNVRGESTAKTRKA